MNADKHRCYLRTIIFRCGLPMKLDNEIHLRLSAFISGPTYLFAWGRVAVSG
jgi:hypothetical protein